ncbi:MAG: hypothetical protein EZS28_008275 [Streblomastix strix]|uniref:Uncharacterized protein n=1 Tax=Streblomastix strix TaxID=222440 RepID=A0A5J4WP44_9EUKA|nr:MAG: hypothetical protein EZS28_008275 [Streblomastix strix]
MRVEDVNASMLILADINARNKAQINSMNQIVDSVGENMRLREIKFRTTIDQHKMLIEDIRSSQFKLIQGKAYSKPKQYVFETRSQKSCKTQTNSRNKQKSSTKTQKDSLKSSKICMRRKFSREISKKNRKGFVYRKKDLIMKQRGINMRKKQHC